MNLGLIIFQCISFSLSIWKKVKQKKSSPTDDDGGIDEPSVKFISHVN